MKKRLVILLAGLLTVLSMGFGLAQFSDVPAGHWAKEAVEALAAKGLVIGFPDGTFRGNETLTRYQAALIIYRLLQQIEAELKAKGESPTMKALSEEDLQALRNAIQELASELAALGVRVSALEDNAATKDDIARLEAMIQELKAQPMPEPGMDQAALQELMDRVEAASIAADTALAQAQQLAEQLEALSQEVEGVKGDVSALQTQVEANAGAIQALNELAILLNQDVLTLQDRVTALEKGLAELQGVSFEEFATKEDVAAVQEFAAALRSDLVKLADRVGALEGKTGELEKKVATLERNAFTISGSLSLNYYQYYKTGAAQAFDVDRLFSSNFSSGDSNGNGLVVDEPDLGPNDTEGATTATLRLKLQTKGLDAKSTPGGYNTYPGLVQFSLTGSWTNPSASASVAPNLVVDKVSTTLNVAQGQTLSFTFGRTVRTKFTEYVFDNDAVSRGPGLVASLNPGLLGAQITAVYGSKGGANGDNLYFYGARATLKPLDTLTLGLSAVREATPGSSGTTVFGLDGSLALGPFSLSGEYFSSSPSNASGYYVMASGGLGIFNLKANYRNIGAITAVTQLSGDADPANSRNNAPFHRDQVGYGGEATVSLGIFSLGGYYDTYTGTGARTAYGVNGTVTLGALSLRAYYDAADAGNDGTLDDSASSEKAGPADYLASGLNYTQYGATLSHDGSKPEALIRNLNFTASVNVRPQIASGPGTDIAVYGDYSGSFGILNAKLLGRYHSYTLQGSAAGSYSTLKGGIQASTQALALPLAPSLFGEFVTRQTNGGTANNAETKYAFGVKLNEFLFKNSSLEVKYGAYQGSNISNVLLGSDEKAWDPSVDHIYDTNVNTAGIKGSITGLYVSWTYWDLVLSWGQFQVDNNGTLTTNASAFKIAYTVSF
ncbi:MAG: S-layer protein [Thermus sp.]